MCLRMICSRCLQPQGPENTGKTLASLTALEQLGLIERRGSRYQPVEVTGKKDLSSAPVLRRLAEGEG